MFSGDVFGVGRFSAARKIHPPGPLRFVAMWGRVMKEKDTRGYRKGRS